jgi:HEAT repeat protein
LADEKEDVKVRAVAALALGMVGGAADVGPLAKVLADHPPAPPPAPVTPPVTAAVPATPAKPAPPPPPPDKTVDLRKAAATALGHSGQPTAVPALVASLKDAAEPNTEVRVAAAYALGDAAAAARDERQSEEAIEGLLGALRDKCGDVRVASAYALRRVTVPEGRKTAVAAGLSKAKDDSHYWVRKAATQSMLALQLGD